MPKPRIFVSSTYVDLSGLRTELYNFLILQGMEPVMFERGGIYYDPTKSLDESCYEAVESCDIFVLILGGRYGAPATRSKAGEKTYNSITKEEYQTARKLGIPIYIFIDSRVLGEFGTWAKNKPTRQSIRFSHVDNPLVFKLIEDIYGFQKNNPIFSYSSVTDISNNLRSQFVSLIHQHVSQKRSSPSVSVVCVNSYKLFFFRSQAAKSLKEVSDGTGLSKESLRGFEKLKTNENRLTAACFPSATVEEINVLERFLNCRGQLQGGQNNDFLSSYIQYYATYKGSQPTRQMTDQEPELFEAKAVVFDFDGTLTSRDDDETTWEKIWTSLGYTENECAEYHKQFSEKKITHARWCEITKEKFQDRGLNEVQLRRIADTIRLLPGTRETLHRLKKEGIKIYILSGSIRIIIKHVLGDMFDLFEEVKANDFTFNDEGALTAIQGTRYDFEGKADYLKRIMAENNLAQLEVLFIGNSLNDIWASQSGARTLCINPRFTNPHVVEHWSYCLRKVRDLSEILRFIPLHSGKLGG